MTLHKVFFFCRSKHLFVELVIAVLRGSFCLMQEDVDTLTEVTIAP